MIANLVFKRNVNSEGTTYTELKTVNLNIPGIKKSERWELVGMFDIVTAAPTVEENPTTTEITEAAPTEKAVETDVKSVPKLEKFESPIKTPRMMIRTGDCIRVVNRKSNFTTYNAVSITDDEKIEFYKSFRSKNPNPHKSTPESIVIRKDDVVVDNGYGNKPYAFWNKFMSQRFIVEQHRYMEKEGNNNA
jgi:hypothetical protein